MSVATAPSTPRVFRRTVTFCIVPRDLARLYEPLVSWFADDPYMEVVVDRRESDRRLVDLGPVGEHDRRNADRRVRESESTAAALGYELPRVARRHADRLRVVARAIPVHHRDERRDDDVLARALVAGDRAAAEELRMRHHGRVHGMLAMHTSRRRALELTDQVVDAALADVARGDVRPFVEILGGETSAVMRRHR